VHGREELKADSRGISILVGMSSTIASMALEQMLRCHGYTASGHGREAPEGFAPDLLITDVGRADCILPDLLAIYPRIKTIMIDMGSTKSMGALNCARNITGVLSCGASKGLLLKAMELVSAGKVFIDEHLVHSDQVLTRRGRLPGLTTRQREVTHLVGQGFTDKAIGEKLGVSFRTVKSHLRSIREKLDITRRADLIKLGSNFTPEK
jgi:DNA-binding NarL/FixJ family response regulator